jgi:DNA-binding response OmpR family regulator
VEQTALDRHANPHSILLVEHSDETLLPLTRLLALEGYHVVVARSAGEAMDLIARGPCDLLISDLGLPDRTGLDLIREVKAGHQLKSIALTGFTGDDSVEATRAAGFDRHVSKPVMFEELLATIGELLGARPRA